MLRLYDQDVYELFMDLFDCLPVSCVVNGLYLCMHGGISQRLTSLASINKIDRRREPPDNSLLADLLWADPAHQKNCENFDYADNADRGISCVFGKKPLK